MVFGASTRLEESKIQQCSDTRSRFQLGFKDAQGDAGGWGSRRDPPWLLQLLTDDFGISFASAHHVLADPLTLPAEAIGNPNPGERHELTRAPSEPDCWVKLPFILRHTRAINLLARLAVIRRRQVIDAATYPFVFSLPLIFHSH